MRGMKNMRRTRAAGLALALTLLACGADAAQGQDRQFAPAQQENSKSLRQYSWKLRTEVRKGGETKGTQLHLVRYDADGNVRQTLVSSTSPQIPTHGLRGLVARKKKKEFVELLDDLRAVAKSYGQWRGRVSGTIELKGADKKIDKAVDKLVKQLLKDTKKAV